MKRIIALLSLLVALPAMAGIPYLLVGSDTGLSNEFGIFNRVASNVVTACRFAYTGGTWLGTNSWKPSADGTYDEFVVRDASYAVKTAPWLFSDNDVSNLCNQTAGLFNDTVSAGLGTNFIGTGYHTTGTSLAVGGAKDHSFDLIDLIYEHYRRTGSTNVWFRLRTIASNTFAGQGLSNHLVYVRANLGGNYSGSGWGFSESLSIGGYHTMCSLFRYRACKELDILTRAAGNANTFYTNEMVQIKNNLETYLFDAGQNLFYVGTVNKSYNVDDNPELIITNHDVYASAYAVVIGSGSELLLDKVAYRLLDLKQGNTYRTGIMATFPANEDTYTISGGISQSGGAFGNYQNGGLWPDFSSWVALAIKRVSKNQADQMMADLASHYDVQSVLDVPFEVEGTLTSINPLFDGASLYLDSACMPLMYWSTNSFQR